MVCDRARGVRDVVGVRRELGAAGCRQLTKSKIIFLAQ